MEGASRWYGSQPIRSNETSTIERTRGASHMPWNDRSKSGSTGDLVSPKRKPQFRTWPRKQTTTAMDAKQTRDVATLDAPNAFLQKPVLDTEEIIAIETRSRKVRLNIFATTSELGAPSTELGFVCTPLILLHAYHNLI